MRAWRVHGYGDLRLDEVPDPVPRAGWVVVDVRVVQPSITETLLFQGHKPYLHGLVAEKIAAGPAALFGHDHTYQHYLKNGIHYVISGGGGAPLYDVDKPPTGITQKVVSIENFVKVTVSGSTAHFKAIDINGATIEEYDIKEIGRASCRERV